MNSEINCFVDVNDSKLNFMVSLHKDISFDEFQKSLLPQLAAFPNPIRFSYIDEDGDRVYFESDMELQEALRFAATQEFFILNITTPEKVEPVPIQVEPVPIPQSIPAPVAQTSEKNVLETLQNLKEEFPEMVKEILNETSVKEVTEFIADVCNGEHMDEIHSFVKQIFPKEKKKKCRGGRCKKVQTKPVKVQNNAPRGSIVAPRASHNALCDYCNQRIQGIRFKCLQCPDYDLCEKCEEVNSRTKFHDDSHVFAKIHNPSQSLPSSNSHPHPIRGCPGARFQRISQLENKVSNLEKDIAEIKALLLQSSNNNNNNKDDSSVVVAQENNTASIPEVAPVISSVVAINQPVLSEEEEKCKKALEEMGIEIAASFISDYNCNISDIVDHIM